MISMNRFYGLNRIPKNRLKNHLQAGIQTTLVAAALCAVIPSAFCQTTPVTPAAPAAPAARQGNGQRRNALALAIVPVAVLDMLSPLKDDQKTGIQAIQDRAKTDLEAAADRTARTTVTSKANEDIKAKLTPEQLSAFEKAAPMLGMLNQSRAIPVGALPDVKLTKDQMTKIQGIVEQEQAKLKGLKGAERRTKQQEVNADFKTQVEALLTADQKAAITKFETAHPLGKKRAA